MKSGDETNASLVLENKLAIWGAQAVVAILLSVGGYVLNGVSKRIETLETQSREYSEWKASIQASRFTVTDGLEVWKAIADLKRDIAVLPSASPPQWFVSRVDKLERQIEDVGKKTDELAKEIKSRP